MQLSYSHSNHFLNYILAQGNDLFPGAEGAIAVYYDGVDHEVKYKKRDFKTQSNVITKLELNEQEKEFYKEFRIQRPRFSWVDKDFASQTKRNEDQLSIQREYKNHSLLIRFAGSKDSLSDLMIIFFKNEEHVFRIAGRKNQLSTELKQSLASVYVRCLDLIRKQIENDHKIHEILTSHQQEQGSVKKEGQTEFANFKKKQSILIQSIANQIAKRLIAKDDVQIEWDEDGIEELLKQVDRIEDMEDLIERALIIAINESIGLKNKLTIKAEHLANTKQIKPTQKKKTISAESNRSILLLDRYEVAAVELLQLKKSITGQNLGQQLSPSITAAAISDAIKKHSNKITRLLMEYPDKWPVLRTHFKAIQNKVHYGTIIQEKAS